MKTKFIAASFMLLAIAACSKKDLTPEVTPEPPAPEVDFFNFATTRIANFNLQVVDMQGKPLDKTVISVYNQNPINDNTGGYIEGVIPIISGLTNENGSVLAQTTLATAVDSVYVVVNSTGFANPMKYALSDAQNMNIKIAPVGYNTNSTASSAALMSAPSKAVDMSIYSIHHLTSNLYRMGTWDALGVPSYKTPTRDVITSSMRSNIAGAVPEQYSVTQTHPEYFTNPAKANVNLIEDAEVWLTFVTEGAGYKNVMGYFTYPTNNPPANAAAIGRRYVILPNSSFLYSGGGLIEGDKVKLLYYDEEANEYTDRFPEGTSIGWFIQSNGFQNGTVTNGLWTLYSFKDFNPGNYQQTLVLNDPDNKLMYITFEDISLTAGSDKDYNDVVFYVTASPYEALEQEGVPVVTKPKDTDGDGVPDSHDEYPNDPTVAFNSYYPAKDVFGSVAYEDLWPGKGDYDFNDIVIDLNIQQVLNASNRVVYMLPTFKLRATGATFHNGFALRLGCSPSAVSSVTGQLVPDNSVFNMNTAGVEHGTTTAVIPVFNDAHEVFGRHAMINTMNTQPHVAPVTINMRINFTSPVAQSTLGAAPFDPFMVVNKNRSIEVHLPGIAPTALADMSLLGTMVDASRPSKGIYYMSHSGLPWAISIPESFVYPLEKVSIQDAHRRFTPWANSKGVAFKDWYMNKPNYRDNALLYQF